MTQYTIKPLEWTNKYEARVILGVYQIFLDDTERPWMWEFNTLDYRRFSGTDYKSLEDARQGANNHWHEILASELEVTE